LRYIAAQDAIPALGTKLMNEVLGRTTGTAQ
jgi:hypothetical protein